MIFPEGSLNCNRSILKFKPGAFAPGKPVQPVVHKFPYKYFNPTWTGDSYGGFGFDKILYLNCCQFWNRVDVAVLPTYYPDEAEKADPKLFAENVRNLMAYAAEYAISDSYADWDGYKANVLDAAKKTGPVLSSDTRSENKETLTKKNK
jgi:lysophosphatidylcholine acyltransferase/lyso-PAF acetyltransferase